MLNLDYFYKTVCLLHWLIQCVSLFLPRHKCVHLALYMF